ncbi:MAG TPA: uL22 family ribosomal protein, partial [Anaeromyxobacteraceae bacterium]
MAEKKKTEKKAPDKKAAAAKSAAAAPSTEAAPRPPARKAAVAPPGGPHAVLRFLRVSPRKVRLVANEVRGMKVGDALAVLKFTPQAAAKPLA